MQFLGKMRLVVSTLFFFVFSVVFGQNVTIIDVDTGEPIFGAALYNKVKTKTVTSSLDGVANISAFSQNEHIYISHIGYNEKRVSKRKIRNNKIYLYKKTQQLDEIVLSISKWQQQKKNIPQKIASINAASVLINNPQTSADLLQSTGQVYVQKSQLGGGSPMIRGFATNRVLLSVDGVRMNNAIFRGGNLQNVISIDPLAVSKTEIIFGPGSVIYGSDAIGGVMNFYTKAPQFSNTDSLQVTGNVLGRYASANKETTGHVDIAVSKKKWGFLTSVSHSNFDDLYMGTNGPDEYLRNFYVKRVNGTDVVQVNTNPRKQVPTGFNQLSLMQKIRHKPSERWEYNLGVHYSATSNYPRYDRLLRTRNGPPRSAEWYYGPQRWFLGNFNIQHKNNSNLCDALKATLAYQNFQESRHNRDFQDDILFNNHEKVDAISANLDFEKRLTDNTKLFYGLEYVFNKVHSTGNEENIVTGAKNEAASRYPDGARWQTAAGYVNFEHKLSNKLTALAGLRYSHAFANAEFNNTFYNFPFSKTNVDNGALTGSLGISWLPGDQWQITVNGSTGFRAPNLDDIGKVFDSEPGSVVVPNPNLEAEYAYNAEAGIRKNFNDKFIVSGAAYYTYLKDALVRRDYMLNGETQIMYQGELSNVQAIQNTAKAYVYGFEFGLEAYFTEELSLSSHLTITEGNEELENGKEAPLRHAAPMFGDVHLMWKSNRLKLNLFTNFNDEVSFNDLAPSEQNKDYLYAIDKEGNPYSPSWYTLNFRSQYRLVDGLFATVSVENITNQRYRTYSSGIAAAGANFIASLSYKF
jgi:hemoglobin/transferrin/lactoferrin receptor protein